MFSITTMRPSVLVWLALTLAPLAWAQTQNAATVGAKKASAAAPAPAAQVAAPVRAASGDIAATASGTGMGQPAVLVAANSDEATVNVVLRDIDTKPGNADLSAGLLVNTLQPNLVTRPVVTARNITAVVGTTRDYAAELRIVGLFPFGESSAPLLYKGRQVEQLRFSKPGMLIRPAAEGGAVARQGSALLFPLVLENPSGAAYKTVRARLRFADKDVCSFDAEAFAAAPAAEVAASAGGAPPKKTPSPVPANCAFYLDWTAFAVPSYAAVTLRVPLAPEWFSDPGSGLPRSGKKKGLLTLRFEGESGGLIQEQNLPLEVQFEPTAGALGWSLGYVALMLVVGAGISLLLRVSVPNIKRKQALRDQLVEASKLTASISSEVDSTLRVLLRVMRLELNEIRQATFAFGPSYADYALRVEQALPTLRRRIEAVRRLDATTIRLRLMLEQNPAPTRMEQVEGHLDAVSETLKQDSLSDEDWVFVNQRLEAAQKVLREPTPTEKEAFDAMLAGRWKAIKSHFGPLVDGALKVPDRLLDMRDCFPEKSLLPAASGDDDGSKWIQAIGPTRADLQLSALALLWEFHFLMPAGDASKEAPWLGAKTELNRLLATPVVSNLRQAKSLLRQLAEGVAETDIMQALQQGKASITMDPAIPRPNQRIRFSVRFHESRLNVAAARDLLTCRWRFHDRTVTPLARGWRGVRDRVRSWFRAGQGADVTRIKTLYEDGWSVHHYFEKTVDQSAIELNFHDSGGMPVVLSAAGSGGGVWFRKDEPPVPVEASGRPQERWSRASLEAFQLVAALLVPLATLASQSINEASIGNWWQLVAIGFASDTIKSILVGRPESSAGK